MLALTSGHEVVLRVDASNGEAYLLEAEPQEGTSGDTQEPQLTPLGDRHRIRLPESIEIMSMTIDGDSVGEGDIPFYSTGGAKAAEIELGLNDGGSEVKRISINKVTGRTKISDTAVGNNANTTPYIHTQACVCGCVLRVDGSACCDRVDYHRTRRSDVGYFRRHSRANSSKVLPDGGMLAEQKMIDLENDPELEAGQNHGNFGNTYAGFTWESEVVTIEDTDDGPKGLYKVTVMVTQDTEPEYGRKATLVTYLLPAGEDIMQQYIYRGHESRRAAERFYRFYAAGIDDCHQHGDPCSSYRQRIRHWSACLGTSTAPDPMLIRKTAL